MYIYTQTLRFSLCGTMTINEHGPLVFQRYVGTIVSCKIVFFLPLHRTIRWLDRCIKAHKRPHDQNLFPIVQGGLYPELRKKCAEGKKCARY